MSQYAEKQDVSNKSHALQAMLNPNSVAFVGASASEGTIGNDMIRTLVDGGYEGDIYLINPKYTEIENRPCYASLSSLPKTPDLVVLSVAGHRIEGLFDEAIKVGAGGVVAAPTPVEDSRAQTNKATRTIFEFFRTGCFFMKPVLFAFLALLVFPVAPARPRQWRRTCRG